MALLRVAHITPSFHPATIYGGAVESTYQTCRHLAELGAEVRVLTTNANGRKTTLGMVPDREIGLEQRLQVRYCRRLAFQTVSPSFLYQLPSLVSWADVVHLTAVYNFPTIPTLAACASVRKPVVWSPRGALQRWVGWRKPELKVLWERTCRLTAPSKLWLHVTSELEARSAMSAFPGHPIKVIPNGVAIPDTIEHIEAGEVLRLLFIGRLDPKKGLENLFEACAKLRADGERKWTLTVAGLGEPSYTKELESIVKTLELKQRVAFVGDVRGSEKAAVFAGSDLTIVPSHIENFGVVVAESLAHGVPVIASRGTPWSRLEEMRCGLWVDNHPGTLAEAIIRMRNLPLIEMGANGRAWMRREFAWSSVAKDLLDLYQEVAG